MNVEFTGRGFVINTKHRQLAQSELERIEKMIGRAVSAHVILAEDRYRMIAEVTLVAPTETLVATCEGTDMLTALHDALRKVEQQAVKHKERRMTVERHAKPDSAEPLIEVVSPGQAG